jgi:hypothetical protein
MFFFFIWVCYTDCSTAALKPSLVVCCAARQRISIASQKRRLFFLSEKSYKVASSYPRYYALLPPFSRARSSGNVQVFVDALGTTTTYEAYLSSLFPGINFTVTTKADSKFKIVGAASVAAKVTRDACVDGWVFEEGSSSGAESPWGAELGSGYPAGVLAFLAF